MWRSYFYPRTPCGVRHVFAPGRDLIAVFLSTYPVRGTTLVSLPADLQKPISIHVPRAGYDVVWHLLS